MNILQTDIDKLREQLAAKEAIIEQQKRESKEKEEQSWEYNFKIIKEEYKRKYSRALEAIKKLEKRRRTFFDRFSTKQLLEMDNSISIYKKTYQNEKALFNCLQRLDKRLEKLEEQVSQK